MIDKFQHIAASIQFLRIPAIVLGVFCLVAIAVVILGLGPVEGNRYLVPSVIGIIWALATYSFVATFETIPAPVNRSGGFLEKLKRRLSRAWYWLIALAFAGTTVFALILSGRLLSIWLRG